MINFDRFQSKEDAIERLLLDIKKFKMALPDNFQPSSLLEVSKNIANHFRGMEKEFVTLSTI
jgi:hypothetical protein